MNTDSWNYYHKISANGIRGMSQTTYEPLINPEGNVFCANFTLNSEYHKDMEPRPLYTQEVVNWFFDNEVKNLEQISNKSYCPDVLDIDFLNKKIFVKWYKHSCNEIVYSGNPWPKQWLKQFREIMIDLVNEGYYKLTMYSHCHYITDHGVMKSIDWYGCLPKNKPLVPQNCMDAIIHDSAKFRLEETGPAINGYYNMETMFKMGLREHVLWGNCNLKFIYHEIFSI